MKETEQQVPAAETERMMKIQEVILKAMAGQLKWWEAAEIIGITDRTMREHQIHLVIVPIRHHRLTGDAD